jgi:hypothetical protein
LFSIMNNIPTILKVRYNSYDIVELPNMCSLYDLSKLIINPLPLQFPGSTIAVRKLKPLHII